ncbi:hypothetical protein RRG08_047303 [Elysia crispata]|uniref:Uncharacterized protein n=1 Tax=Elysia crispata TaxID=231223 RepID=A0AAE0YYS4_9GAST|nr:hypothetical protein RRG08_047303 [Elysia crispata]
MALGMSESAFSAKEKFLDELEEQFLKNVKDFTSDVKKTMRNASRECAMEIFEMAIAFLTQVFPNPTNLGASLCDSDDIQSLSKRISDVETKETLMEKKFNKGLEKLTKSKKFYSKQISGLRKLQTVIVKERIKATQTAAATTTTASGLASAAATTAQQRSVQKLSPKTFFSAKFPQDTKDPRIIDAKLLPGGLVLLADIWNSCVKLFNRHGQLLHREVLDAEPLRLTVMDSTPTCMWDVALTLSKTSQIAILRVISNSLSLKTSIQTAKPCVAIAAVDAKTLAVGYFAEFGIDLIDLSGTVLRQISSNFHPKYMATTSDKCLVMALASKEIGKQNLADGDTLYIIKAEHLKNPRGITDFQDGSCLVVDQISRKVHWEREKIERAHKNSMKSLLRTIMTRNSDNSS